MLLRIVGRFSCFALQKAWTAELKEALDELATDEDDTVQEVSNLKPTIILISFELEITFLGFISARQKYDRRIFIFFILQCSENQLTYFF